jgi:prolyl 4-hydroxylase
MQIIETPHLLSPKECSHIIELAKSQGIYEAETVGEPIDGYRTADNCWISSGDDIIDWLEDYISKQIGTPVENFELAHVVKYGIGGEYKEHHDWFDENFEEHKSELGKSGNRTHSYIVYLNDTFKGGETEFIKLNKKVKPELGKGLMWTNIIDGECLDESFHAGLPVTEGEKWILIYWIRENKFR